MVSFLRPISPKASVSLCSGASSTNYLPQNDDVVLAGTRLDRNLVDELSVLLLCQWRVCFSPLEESRRRRFCSLRIEGRQVVDAIEEDEVLQLKDKFLCLTEQIQEIAPRCMLFADDIVLLGESREELNERNTWLSPKQKQIGVYMECKFNKRRRVSNSKVKIGDHIIPQVTRFKYLGSVIQDDGEMEGDVNHRIQVGWMKWRKASGVLCDAKVPIKLKGKFYRTANKVGVAEMRMLRWMCGKTRQDKIRNEAIRERVRVAPIVEKMVENRLRWFGHVERRPVDSVVRRVAQMERRQTIRGRGRPKKTIREVIKRDLELNNLDRSMVLDRTLWRKLIHVADPT
ncbi:hypothetical protein HKD37_05G013655 [Glycine soja]